MIIILVGLSGSGKTWYAKNKLKYDYFVDDPKCLFDFPSSLGMDEVLVIADPTLCVDEIRNNIDMSRYPGHSIQFIFFENDPIKCWSNVEHRQKNGDRRNISKNKMFQQSSKYNIPEEYEPIQIWSPYDQDD